MKGELVIARGFQDAALVRRVWGTGNGLVYLSTEAEFAKLKDGKDALLPIGFPAGDVFVYDEMQCRWLLGHNPDSLA